MKSPQFIRKKKSAKVPSDPNRVAILSVGHANGSTSETGVIGCDGILVRIQDGKIELLDTESFSGTTSLDDAGSWLEQHLTSRVVILLAGSDVICRTMTLPAASQDQLEMALRLQVENLLLGGAARWRTNAVLLPTTDPDSQRTALMVEWPTSIAGPVLPSIISDQPDLSYAPPIAALMALVTGAIARGDRESLAVYLERATGAISIAYSDGIHSAFRTLREAGGKNGGDAGGEAGEDDAEWTASILRSVGETLLLADIPKPAMDIALEAMRANLDAQSDGLLAPLSDGAPFGENSFQSSSQSRPTDRAWWKRYGVLLGTAIALTGPLARIASLKAGAAKTNQGFLPRMIATAQTPRVAIQLAVAALIVWALVPLALSGARLVYMRWKLPDSEAYERSLVRLDHQTAMYSEYEKYAWPMGKLLGDLASATPEGIELELISITQGAPVSLQGVAKPQGSNGAAEAILLMERQLRESRVFDRVEKNWEAPNANGVIKFTINTTVVNPSLVPNYPEAQDFARRTLRDRRYGAAETDAGSGSTSRTTISSDAPLIPPATESASAATSTIRPDPTVKIDTPPLIDPVSPNGDPVQTAQDDADSRSLNRKSAAGGSAAPDTNRRGRGPTESEAVAIPAPLTTEQIAAMTQAEAREYLGRVSTARKTPGIDPAVEARLRDEFYQLLEQAKRK